MKKIAMIMSCLMLLSVTGKAQVIARVEYPYKDYKNIFTLPMGKHGVLEMLFNDDTQHDQRWVKLEHYDTNLRLVTKDSLLMDKGMSYYQGEVNGDMCYVMMRNKNDFKILAYNATTHKTHFVDGEYTRKGDMRDLTIGKGHMVFSSTQKKLDRIGIVNLSSGKSKFIDLHLEGIRDKDILVMEHAIIDDEINSLVRVGRDVILMRFGLDGSLHERIWLTENIDKEAIISASISKVGSKYFLTGTYTNGKHALAQGIYFAQLEGDKFKFIKFYNFLDLKNFTEFMSDKKKTKVERKKEKAEKKGKEYNLNYRMANHDIMEADGYYYYLGEAYYPTYATYYTGNSSVTVFDGYAYTHAILVKFDQKGNIIWDSCFPMEYPSKPFYVKRFISANLKGSTVNAIFTDGKNMMSKFFSNANGSVVKEKKTERIETDEEQEEVKKARTTNSQHWYDENFLVYGYQIVKDNKTGERRRVFYTQKYTIK